MRATTDSSMIVSGSVSLDLRRFVVRIGEISWPIRKRDAVLLKFFMESAGRVVPRDELRRALWGDVEVSSRAIETTLTRFRQALHERDVGRIIRTVHSTGYQFTGAPEAFRVKGGARAPMLKPRKMQADHETAHSHR